MVKISIPSKFLNGFHEIKSLTNDQVSKIASFIEQLPVGITNTKFIDAFEEKFSEFNTIDETILSLAALDLSDLNCDSYNILAQVLVEDYILQFPNIKPEEISLLQNNLLIILDKISPLALSAKAFNLLSENKTTFIESRIISDIRLVFDNDIIKKNRLAVLVHNLKIVTTENDERKEFYFSLDTNDLKMLKTQIERAEKKDELIRHQYSNEIQFIKIND